MRTRRAPSLLALGAATALALAACASGGSTAGPSGSSGSGPADGTPTATASSAPPSSASPSTSPTAGGDDDGVEPTASPLPADDPTDDQPFPADLAPDLQEAGGDARLGLTGIRVGLGEGYERVVLDLEGTGQPGWDAQYRTTGPAQEGSGDPVEVDGDAVLWVTVTGLAYPGDGVTDVTAAPRTDPEGTEVVEEVVYDGVFEGQAQVWIGLDEQRPFRVFRLEDPARVVIDVVGTDG
ncbi:AMIN-like domain-containing (lipo)protein [Cellulomonas marina]|uniref:AMIN-like domain-containing protein n=1 Tax=Cellulomonas marina TaxID=988821 RepID=A0A1I1AS00_9CELL|nr:hypothetical protein [Cellulomonas marina]GIG30446.1 hypothetical protein Cma02nite_30460 [Cellulomonas marina]SFB39110.1 hypothetical protein SAMN05421867_12020 [Cellulomonas marina]